MLIGLTDRSPRLPLFFSFLYTLGGLFIHAHVCGASVAGRRVEKCDFIWEILKIVFRPHNAVPHWYPPHPAQKNIPACTRSHRRESRKYSGAAAAIQWQGRWNTVVAPLCAPPLWRQETGRPALPTALPYCLSSPFLYTLGGLFTHAHVCRPSVAGRRVKKCDFIWEILKIIFQPHKVAPP